MRSRDLPLPRSNDVPVETAGQLEELVNRVASSSTFERSPRLRAFFHHVCRCALENRPEAATEQQIGIHVYDRPPGYNPNEDNIVRSQARLLRMKLEHYFANEGRDEPVIITIPKGRYVPVFETRPEGGAASPGIKDPAPRKSRSSFQILIGVAGLLGVVIVCLGYLLFESRSPSQPSAARADSVSRAAQAEAAPTSANRLPGLPPEPGAVRIAAGRTGAQYVDVWGRRWEADRYYEGGVSKPGPRDLFPPVADPGLYTTIREALSTEFGAPESDRVFRYNIPVRPGVYELRLYFADPLRHADVERQGDAQNYRHFGVNANGRVLLSSFDPIADAGPAAVDVRAFKDIYPAEDGMVHLEFVPGPGLPFVSAIELVPGTPGKLKPVRLSARPQGFVAPDGTRWEADKYFVNGRTGVYANPKTGPKVPELYTSERYGNFSYAIPVPPGSYTVTLHFAETFYTHSAAVAGLCAGPGCRIFDVTCNGVALLDNFDISQAAPAEFSPVVRTFRGLRPNGQGKLLLSFSPRMNYAEVRAIEVIDEAK